MTRVTALLFDDSSERVKGRAAALLFAAEGAKLGLVDRDADATHAVAAEIHATGEDALELMRRAYAAYALDWAHRYAAMFDLLLQETRRPLLS